MKNQKKKPIKQKYLTPEINIILLDNEISLALESNPPFLEGENIVSSSEYKSTSPFQIS